MAKRDPEDRKIPEIRPHQWISIGDIEAVVVKEFEDKFQGDISIIYIDRRDRAIKTSATWKSDHWEFSSKGPDGSYVDGDGAYASFVSQARRGRY